MSFRNVQFMTPLPSVVLPKQEEENVDYRPVTRQRTVGSETSKDKSGALPPAVYTKQSSVQANVLCIPSKSSNNSDGKVQQVSKPSSERPKTPDNNSETTDALFCYTYIYFLLYSILCKTREGHIVNYWATSKLCYPR